MEQSISGQWKKRTADYTLETVDWGEMHTEGKMQSVDFLTESPFPSLRINRKLANRVVIEAYPSDIQANQSIANFH